MMMIHTGLIFAKASPRSVVRIAQPEDISREKRACADRQIENEDGNNNGLNPSQWVAWHDRSEFLCSCVGRKKEEVANLSRRD